MILTGIGIAGSQCAPSYGTIVQCFTANGTWNCCPNTVCVEVVAIGAGGGGRAAVNPNIRPPMGNPGAALGGPGGGAGGISICTLTSGFGTSQSVVIGTSSVNANGGASCFGTLVRAGGGFAGAAAFACCGAGVNISAAGGAGGTGNQGTSPVGGCTCACPQGLNNGQPGGSAVGFPAGGGGGASVGECLSLYQGSYGLGGTGSTLCGINLGQGGTGGGPTIGINGFGGVPFGSGGGGGGHDGFSGEYGTGVAGAPGIVKVTQYVSCVVQCFTANGTWSCCPGAVCIEVVAVGAGGGGRCSAPFSFGGTQLILGGPGGGAGGVSLCTLTSGFGTSQSIVVGTSAAETNGGASCFGTLVCSGGGQVGAVATSQPSSGSITAAGGAGGVGNMGTSPSGGGTKASTPRDFTANTGNPGCSATGFPGGAGGAGSNTVQGGGDTTGGGGAAGSGSTFCGITLGGGGTGGSTTNRNGLSGQSFGGGGGGGVAMQEGSPRYAGSAGAAGIVKVTQYFS